MSYVARSEIWVMTYTFELRAACDLARLWRDHGKRDMARDLLAPVCSSLSEASGRELEDARVLHSISYCKANSDAARITRRRRHRIG
jgi:hypothetical protein